jgi:hypothetical protein
MFLFSIVVQVCNVSGPVTLEVYFDQYIARFLPLTRILTKPKVALSDTLGKSNIRMGALGCAVLSAS